MNKTTAESQLPEYVDVLIIGAGLSGIGAACHLKRNMPNKSFAIFESRSALGGTWDLFRYPGIRSDSDMFTLGYSFKPWTSTQGLADGAAIKQYITDTAKEHQLEQTISYNIEVKAINWLSNSAQWQVSFNNKNSGKPGVVYCHFIHSCCGYYNYKHGYMPSFKNQEAFKGSIVHPQDWPEDLVYKGKKVVIIGSGATAVTLLPELANDADQVTMLQRSPTYMGTIPSEDAIAARFQKLFSEKTAYTLSRIQKVGFQWLVYQLSMRFPKMMRRLLLDRVREEVGPSVEMKHFRPNYNPWEQRLCAVKGGDLFKAVREGKANIVTDHIDHFTEKGIMLKSGDELEADIIITATGLDLLFFGGIKITTDGQAYDHTQKMVYKGLMLEDLPNLAFSMGYTNASWTLKADLSCEYVCRLLKVMENTETQQCVPVNLNPNIEKESFLQLSAGYVERAADQLPKNGKKLPWKLAQNYLIDLFYLRYAPVRDKAMMFTKTRGAEHQAATSSSSDSSPNKAA